MKWQIKNGKEMLEVNRSLNVERLLPFAGKESLHLLGQASQNSTASCRSLLMGKPVIILCHLFIYLDNG